MHNFFSINRNLLLGSFCLLFTVTTVNAQSTNSIYSAYGIGDVSIRDWNGYTSMGGLGIALKSERTLNDLNPASYSALTNHRYILEVAAAGSSIHYVSDDNNITGADLNIKRAAFGMNLVKNLGTVFGLKQYSHVGYQSDATRAIAGTTTTLSETITGSGGLNMAYMGNGYRINKHLAIGVTAAFMFGSVTKNEQMYFSTTDGLNIQTNSFYQKLLLNAGMQYDFNMGKLHWILGATVQPRVNLNKQDDFTIKDFSDSTLVAADAIRSDFKYPLQAAAGITVAKGGSKLGVDYIKQYWSNTGYKGKSFSTTDLQNFAVGYSYTFFKNSYYGPVERLSIMAGFQKELSYIILNNQQVSSIMGTAGVNIPSKRGIFNYSVGVRVGERGRVSYPLVKEKFVDFTFNISLMDRFLTGVKRYD